MLSFSLITFFSIAQTEVTFYTTKGNFVVRMEDSKRPITTANFLNLVTSKFYDGIIFHRVIDGFMIQGGDPTGTGSGGSALVIPDEFTPFVSNLQKTIAMANSGPNTGTSQFFINLVNNTYLNPNHPVFGIVISNFSVVQAIGIVPVDANDKPLTNVVMDSLRITYIPTEIKEMKNQLSDVEIYPNPISNESIITLKSIFNGVTNISIYNQLGEVIYKSTKSLTTGINYFSFNDICINKLNQGVYYLIVEDKSSISKHKFIIF